MQSSVMVQAVVQMTPETLGAATKAARASGLSLERWLADAVELSYSVSDGLLDAPWDRASMELFAAVASASPGLLQDEWRVLFDLVSADPRLWRQPAYTLTEIEEGLAALESGVIDRNALAARWAALIAQAFSR